MHIVDMGHAFDLSTLDGDGWQRLTFVKRLGAKYPGNVGPEHPGTNCQEVLRAVHSRLWYLDSQIPSWWTRVAAKLIAWSIWCLEVRAAKRHGRKWPNLHDAIYGFTCWKCGHVGCYQHCMLAGSNPLERWGV